MTGILKVDTIQKNDGATPTAKDLGINVTGNILQIVNVPFTASYSSSTSGFTNVTGFAATITPTSATSKIMVQISLGKVATSYASFNTIAFRMIRNGSVVLSGNTEGSRPAISFAMMRSNPNSDHTMGLSWQGYDSPSSTSALTYQLQAWAENNGTYYINRSENNNDENQPYRGISYSSITLVEVAA